MGRKGDAALHPAKLCATMPRSLHYVRMNYDHLFSLEIFESFNQSGLIIRRATTRDCSVH